MSAECGVRNAESRVVSAESRGVSAESRVVSAESRVVSAKSRGAVYPLPEIAALLVCEGQDQYANLKRRTKQYALRIFRFARALPNDQAAKMIQNQVVRAGGSVAANYRAACRAKSTADFIYKMGIVEEETDETMLWIELAVEDGLIPEDRIKDLYQEADEILSIVIQSIRTAKQGKS